MDNVTTTCYLCERMFDIDELQRFQPGFVLQLSLNAEACAKKPPDAFARPNGHIRPLPDIDEIREQNNMLDLELPLIRPPRVLQKKRKYGDGHICEYDRYTSDGRCLHCLEEHNFCRLLNYQSRCQVCYRLAENCPEEESKSFYLTSRLLHLHKTQPIPRVSTDFAHGGFSDGVSSNLKVIVFSQFRAALNVVGDRLLRRFGTACIAEYFGNHRKEELHKFTYEPGCFCLLLTKDGSEGLDLSFVTNMVFFEEIYDKSLQDQAIARAWRMGSKCTLQVETLVAARSIEEVLGDPNETLCHGNDTGSASSIGDQQRLKSLLQSLRFVTDYHSFSSDETSFSVSGPEKNDNRAFLGRKQSIPLFSKDCISHPSKRTKKIVHFSKTLREDHFAASASI